MFQFTFGQFSGEQQHGEQAHILKRRPPCSRFLCRDFPVERRANAEAETWGVSAETLGPRKNSPPLIRRLRKKRTKLKIEEERQHARLKRRRCEEV